MYEIPADRLPPGFGETIDDPPDRPAEPRPAATTVLIRDGEGGLEALLMRRHRRSGFVPGAWVFPGGRVDPGDADPGLLDQVRGLDRDPVPGPRYWMAAIRELFEETGILLARTQGGAVIDGADPSADELRRALMEEQATLSDVVRALGVTLDASGMVHIAHWVTPVVEPRRYDTHFFAVAAPSGRRVVADPREMTESVWVRPATALARFEQGELPMVFPTVKTLATLREHDSVDDLLDAFRRVRVPRILPRLVRTDGGVGIVVDDEDVQAGTESPEPEPEAR